MPTNKELEQQLQESQESVADLSGKLEKVIDSTNSALEDIEARVQLSADETNNKLDALLNAINNPVSLKHPGQIEPMEQSLGEDHVHEFSVVDGEAVIATPKVTDVSSPEFRTKANMLKFNEEPVTIIIHETSEKDADQFFDVSVNNKTEIFKRGEAKTVARKFVEQLCRAKPVHYENQEYTGQDGVRGVRYPSRRGLRYPFSVIEDRNPSGSQWLKAILAQS